MSNEAKRLTAEELQTALCDEDLCGLENHISALEAEIAELREYKELCEWVDSWFTKDPTGDCPFDFAFLLESEPNLFHALKKAKQLWEAAKKD